MNLDVNALSKRKRISEYDYEIIPKVEINVTDSKRRSFKELLGRSIKKEADRFYVISDEEDSSEMKLYKEKSSPSRGFVTKREMVPEDRV